MSHYDTLSMIIVIGFVINTMIVGTIGWIAGRRYESLINTMDATENIRPLFPIPPQYEEETSSPIDWTKLPLQHEAITGETVAYVPDELADNT